jgi:hypothetical protein
MVRRAAAQKLGPFAAVLERDSVSKVLLPLFTELTSDGEIEITAYTYRQQVLLSSKWILQSDMQAGASSLVGRKPRRRWSHLAVSTALHCFRG